MQRAPLTCILSGDYKQPDENGYGKLTGLRIAAQEEYESNTGSFSSKNNGIETAE